jgi:hypothetical protein
MESPGVGSYQADPARVGKCLRIIFYLVHLSSYRHASQFSVPKSDRGLLHLRKDDMPNVMTYQNPNEIFNKSIAKKEG